jgi:hypothetical protein
MYFRFTDHLHESVHTGTGQADTVEQVELCALMKMGRRNDVWRSAACNVWTQYSQSKGVRH